MRGTKLAVMAILAAAVALSSACSFGGGSQATPVPPLAAAKSQEPVKPKPLVTSVAASTTGMLDSYYAIVEATVQNNGADGMVIVVGTVTQGGEARKNELPIYIANNTAQTVRLVFPLKWRGGDWTPNVQTEIP